MPQDEREMFTANRLAGMAECASPDSQESPGAEWLELVQSVTAEMLDDLSDNSTRDEIGDEIAERADGVVPIYTHEVWSVFVDLSAYQELGFDGKDMEQGAKIALYMIAERLIGALIEEWRGEVDSDSTN